MFALFILAATAASRPHAAPDMSTRDGLIAGYTAMFKRIDTDGDDRISRLEWAAMAESSPMLQSASLSEAQRNSLRAALMAGFDQNDSDRDGNLTLDELMAKPLVRFACLDADHNAKVTQTEAEAGMDTCSAPAGVGR